MKPAIPINSLERLVPETLRSEEVTGQLTLELHLERYRFAAEHAKPGRILDIACGVGYGTSLLREEIASVQEVIGVDCSEEAVEYAKQTYQKPGIHFLTDDAMKFDDPDGFETIVSLETIEHVPDPGGLISRLLRLLKPGGIFIGSVPTTPTVDANPHHMHDFTEESFRRLLLPHRVCEIAHLRQLQPYNPLAVLTRREQRLQDLRPNLMQYYLTDPIAFFQRVASTIRFGFTNRYVTIAWTKPEQA